MLDLLLAFASIALAILVGIAYAKIRELELRATRQDRALAKLLDQLPVPSEPATGEFVTATREAVAPAPPEAAVEPRTPAPAPAEPADEIRRRAAVAPPLPDARRRAELANELSAALASTHAKEARGPSQQAPRKPKFEWERWVGVRGFAVLGGIAAALAALLFFQYAFDHGWISPSLRVAFGLGGGSAAIVAGDRLSKRRYRVAPQALIGAGLVALYAAAWAASERYGLWSQPTSWGVMAATTAVGCLLSFRHGSALVAVLGVLGGFATPVVVSGSDVDPYAFFGYLLLLDVALLVLGRARGWPFLGLFGLVGTAALAIVWLGRSFSPAEQALFLVVLGLIAAVFGAGARHVSVPSHLTTATRGLGVLLPFPFVLHLLMHSDDMPAIGSVAVLAVLLTTGSLVLSKQRGLEALPALCVASWLALLSVWVDREQRLDLAFAGMALAMSLLPAIGLVLVRRRATAALPSNGPDAAAVDAPAPDKRVPALGIAAAIALAGHGGLLFLGTGSGDVVLGALVTVAFTLVALAAVVARTSTVAWTSTAVAAVVAAGLVRHLAGGVESAGSTKSWIEVGIVAAFIAFNHAASLWTARRTEVVFDRALAALGALAATAIPLYAFELLADRIGESTLLACLAYAVLVAALLIAAVRTSWGWTMFVALVAAIVGSAGFATADPSDDVQIAGMAARWLAALAFVMAARDPRLLMSRAAIASVCGALLLFYVASHTYSILSFAHGDELARGLPFAALAAWAAYTGVGRQRGAGLGLTTVAAAILASSVARELDIEPLIVGLALFTLCLAAATFSSRLQDLRLLRIGAVAVFVASDLLLPRFVGLPPHVAPPNVLFSGLSLAHVLPIVAAALLVRRFIAVAPGERVLPVMAACVAAVDAFMWLTILVLGYFATSSDIRWPAAGDQSIQLALSLMWIAYALALLAVGMARRVAGWRWASLVVLLITIGKVFLIDLGDLEGLMRVASIAGLGLTLILVSLLYQRFVFRREPSAPTTPQG